MANKTKVKKHIWQVIRLPLHLIAVLHKLISEKLEFSLRFRLSFSYFRILLTAMLTAGLGVMLVYGTLTIYDNIAQKYQALSGLLQGDKLEYSDIGLYSKEHQSDVLIYDYERELLYATQPELAVHGYKAIISFVKAGDDLYLAINRRAFDAGRPVRVVMYAKISGEIAQLVEIARITLYVYAVVILFSLVSIGLLGQGFFQPLKEMTQTVKDISERNLNLRLNVSGSKNELKELALTFNEMMNRIEDHYNRQKQFVADASHELRTPIAVIQGYADMLSRWGKNDPEVLEESVGAIKNEAENMTELIDKLLFLARHDKDSFVLEKEEFSLTEMLAEIAKETQIIDNAHKLNLSLEKEVSIYADRSRLKQAVRILVDNALKYTPAGGEITIALEDEDDSITIKVKDNGIGMTKEELGNIFDRFYRTERSRSKRGHGLGLAIAKIIILGHKGKIKVVSKAGEGTEFIILLRKG